MKKDSVIHGDNIAVLKSLPAEFAELAVIDPPYFSNRDYADDKGAVQFSDKWKDLDEYLDYMREIIALCHRALKPEGSFYLHVDASASHYLKVEADRVFGMRNFRRHISWAGVNPGGFKSTARNWIRTSDHILYYTRSENFTFNSRFLPLKPESRARYNLTDEDGRKYLIDSKSGKAFYLDQSQGTPLTDNWTDIDVRPFSESTGYPTQKPTRLLKRIIESSSNAGDMVLDCFCGSGSTLVAAKTMGRRFLGIDVNENAVEIARRRLAETFCIDQDMFADE